MSIIVQHRRDSRTNCAANTPAAGELWFDTTLKALRAGDGSTLGGFLQKRWRYNFSVSPAQITANQNDYNPTDLAIAETLFLTSDAARSLTGIAGGSADARITIVNRGGFDITLVNASASSTAANRFLFESDVVIRANGSIELQYSATDSRWMRANGGTKFSTVPQEFLLTGVISPAQITANQNDYAPVDSVTATKTTALASILRLTSDASRNVTGLVDPRDGAVKVIINSGSNPIVLKNADAGSAAANRFDFGADVTLAGKQSARIRYDGTDSRWKLESSTAGAAVGAGAVTAQTIAGSAIGPRSGMINGTIVESHAGSAATFAVKTLAGVDPSAADPVLVPFQTGSGGYVMRSITAALSLTISSGSSMGVAANGTAFRIWHLLIDSGAGVVLGAVNCLSGTNLLAVSEGVQISSAAEGGAGAADVAQVIYTAAAQTAKYLCFAGFSDYDSGLASVGAWAASPTRTILWSAGMPKPGDVVASAQSVTSSVATGTTLIPYDDTIPQNTEGDQYMTFSMGPQGAANVLEVSAIMNFSNSAAAPQATLMALFRDSTANALAAAQQDDTRSGDLNQMAIEDVRVVTGSVTGTTFKVRAGGLGAGTTTFNGNVGTRKMGGVMNSAIKVTEYMG